MRERLEIPRFWWRGAEPRTIARAAAAVTPTTGPRLTGAAAPFSDASELFAEPRAPQKPRQRPGKRGGVLVGVVCAGAVAFVVSSQMGFLRQVTGPIGVQVDQLMLMAGLGVEEIHITGHRYTLDGDIFAALDLERPTSLLRYSSEAARRRVEALSWVDRASVTRVLPDAVEVKITERAPVAVWLHDKTATLVDAHGRHLARVSPSTLPALPRISGAGAPEAVGALVEALTAFPDLSKRVVVSTRVGERRWSLDLDNGSRVHLPAEGESAALDRLMRLGHSAGLLTEPARVVDLRIEDRIAVAPLGIGSTASASPVSQSTVATPEKARARKSASAL